MSKLNRIRTWYTIEQAGRRLSQAFGEEVLAEDVLALTEERKLRATFIPEAVVAPMQEVLPVCQWPRGNADRWADEFLVAGPVVYRRGAFWIVDATLFARDYVASLSNIEAMAASDQMLVHAPDWSGFAGAHLIVEDEQGQRLMVLRETLMPDSGERWFEPSYLFDDDSQFVFHVTQLESLEREEPDPALQGGVSTRWTPEKISEVEKRRARGETLTDIARDFGVSRARLGAVLKKAGNHKAPEPHNPFRLGRDK